MANNVLALEAIDQQKAEENDPWNEGEAVDDVSRDTSPLRRALYLTVDSEAAAGRGETGRSYWWRLPTWGKY